MKSKMIFLSIIAIVIFSMIGSLTDSFAQPLQTSNRSEIAQVIPGWRQVNTSGFGDPHTFAANRMTVFNDTLFASARNDTIGGQLWSSEDGLSWNQVIGGFDKLANISLLVGETFSGTMYMGTDNPVAGAEIWRTPDGTSWEQVVDGGIDDIANYSVERIVVYKDMLYATFSNENTGVEVWRSVTGDDGSWVQVNVDGFGDSNNDGLWAVEVFNDYLYAVTAQLKETSSGVEVWRTDDGTSWAQVNEDGFGYPDMNNPWMESFQGYLYVLSGTPETGTQIWRCALCDGSDWSQVVTDGFGNLANERGEFMIEYKGHLIAATVNSSLGSELWQTADGTHWYKIMSGGFGNPHNRSIWSGAVFNSYLFLGTLNDAGWLNPADGTEIWEKFGNLTYVPFVKR